MRNKKDLDMSQEIHCVNTMHFGIESAIRKPLTEVGSRGLGIDICKQSSALANRRRGRKRKSTEMDDPGPSDQSVQFTRSNTTPLEKNLCFFCQEDTKEKLYKVCTQNAGNYLRSAVEKSKNPAVRTRLNTCISPTDAHAIDVHYDKACWRSNVFHVTRQMPSNTSSSQVHPLQAASLVQITNLVDVKTRQKAYISMDDVERVYRNMLVDVIAHHFPVVSRKWLKERILDELPAVKSLLQKGRRKSAVLYNSTACEEEMVHSLISDGDMDSMKIIFKTAQIIHNSIANFNNDGKPAADDDIPVYAVMLQMFQDNCLAS